VAPDSIHALAPDQLKGLSPQLRRAAQFIIDHTDDVATRSLRHIAQEAGLPPPTFSRLARAIGYESYDALREICRTAISRRRSLLADKALELVDGARDRDAPFLVTHAAAAMRNTQMLLENIDFDEFEAMALRLASARRVVLIGELSARPFVDYASYVAAMSLPNWTVIGRGGGNLSAELVDLGSEDVAVVFSIEPYALRSVETTRAVAARSVYVVSITDSPLSPVAALAASVFIVSAESPQFFPSHVGATVLIEALIGMVVRERGAKSQRRIAQVERQSHELSEYWQETPAPTRGRPTK